MTTVPTIEALRQGDVTALARAMSILEAGGAEAALLSEALASNPRIACRVAVTGPGGVGKSSLLRELCRTLRRDGDRVAVVATDPSSVVTGGALLGDRCRFAELLGDPDVFIRSVAHRGESGQPAPPVAGFADVLDAAGFDWVFLETVGTGQMDTGVFAGADLRVLVLAPECGDDVQMLKAGLVELADIIAVGKADQPGAEAWARRLEQTVVHGPRREPPAVLAVSAQSGAGVPELVAALRQSAAHKKKKGAATTEAERTE